MNKLFATLAFLGVSACLSARADQSAMDGPQSRQIDRLLQSLQNASLTTSGNDVLITRKDHNTPVEMIFTSCQGLGVSREHDQWWVLPTAGVSSKIPANHRLWVLPTDAKSADHSWDIELHDGDASATRTATGLTVLLTADSVTMHPSEARPHSDPSTIAFRSHSPAEMNLKMLWPASTGAPCCPWLSRRRWLQTSPTAADMF